jgi:hypothetical protein
MKERTLIHKVGKYQIKTMWKTNGNVYSECIKRHPLHQPPFEVLAHAVGSTKAKVVKDIKEMYLISIPAERPPSKNWNTRKEYERKIKMLTKIKHRRKRK